MRRSAVRAVTVALMLASLAAHAQSPSGRGRPKYVELEERPSLELKGHRYAFVAGGILFLGGLAFGYWGQAEARRAETIASARESARVYDNARSSAGTANFLYGVAAAAVAYGLVLGLLPPKVAQRASLSWSF
jgi:hypothetical protein